MLTRVVLAVGRGLKRTGGSPASVLEGPASGTDRGPAHGGRAGRPGRRPDRPQAAGDRAAGDGRAGPALKVLPELVDSRQPGQVQLAALQALGGLSDPSVGPLVLAQWKSMSPVVRREAAEVLFAHRDRVESLLSALESKALVPGDIDPDRAKQLRTHKDSSIRSRAVKVLGTEAAASRDRMTLIRSFRPALTLTGRTEKGKAVFIKTCATCHRAFGQGADVAPIWRRSRGVRPKTC